MSAGAAAKPVPGPSPAQFESLDVDVERFDHRAHVYVAWRYLATHDVAETKRRYCRSLRALTESHGIPDKYHATMTHALIDLFAARRYRNPDATWEQFVAGNPALFTKPGALLGAHYSATLLDAPAARQRALPPDRAPFPAPDSATGD